MPRHSALPLSVTAKDQRASTSSQLFHRSDEPIDLRLVFLKLTGHGQRDRVDRLFRLQSVRAPAHRLALVDARAPGGYRRNAVDLPLLQVSLALELLYTRPISVLSAFSISASLPAGETSTATLKLRSVVDSMEYPGTSS